MNKIDFYCSEIHYFDHIAPVWQKLDKAYKGVFYVSEDVMKNRLSAKKWCEIGNPTKNLTLVASYKDYTATKGDVIFMEHGIGHNYGNRHSAYVGGRNRDRVVMFFNQHALSQHENQKWYPHTISKIVGTPKMDTVVKSNDKNTDKPIVCISFHWDCKVCNNTRSAYYYYRSVIPFLSKCDEFKLIAHGHPRGDWTEIKDLGIPFYDDFNEVMRIADIYVNDNSSSMYEFMSMNKPVIVLNCPLYDRSANTGIRFWKYICGKQVDDPKKLYDAILEQIKLPQMYEDLRKEYTEELYPLRGKSAQTAANYIKEYLDERIK